MSLLSEVLTKKMNEKGFNDSELASLVGKSRTYILQIRKGTVNAVPTDELIKKICEVLNIDSTTEENLIKEASFQRTPIIIQDEFNKIKKELENLKSRSNSLKDFTNSHICSDLFTEELVLIPVYDFVQAGTNGDSFAFPEPVDYIHYPKKKAHNAVGIRVKGDSMQPRIFEKDVVVVRLETMPENKQTAVFIYNNESIVKVYNINEKGIIFLSSNNSNYQPILITEADEIKIVGKVIGLVRDMEND